MDCLHLPWSLVWSAKDHFHNPWRICWFFSCYWTFNVWYWGAASCKCWLARCFEVGSGAYLIFLGIQVWRSPSLGESRTEVRASSGGKLFQAGLLSAISNPKGILFFVAFLPQFIDPAGSLFIQFVIMAATFVVIEFIYELLVASLADRIQPWLKRVGKNFNRVFGSVFIAIGALLPLRG